MDPDRYKVNKVIKDDNFWKCVFIYECWWKCETKKIHTHTHLRKKYRVKISPQRLTKPNVSGYIRLAPQEGCCVSLARKDLQLKWCFLAQKRQKIRYWSSAQPDHLITRFSIPKISICFPMDYWKALGYCSTTVSVIWQYHSVSLIAGCKTDIWPPFLTPYCSRQASISSGAWTHFSVEMPKISTSSHIRSQSNGSARRQVLEVIR